MCETTCSAASASAGRGVLADVRCASSRTSAASVVHGVLQRRHPQSLLNCCSSRPQMIAEYLPSVCGVEGVDNGSQCDQRVRSNAAPSGQYNQEARSDVLEITLKSPNEHTAGMCSLIIIAAL